MRLISAVTAILVACIPSAYALPAKHDTSKNEVIEEGMPPVRSLDETIGNVIDTLAVQTDGSVSSKEFQTFQVVDEINDELTASATEIAKKDKATKAPKLTKGTKQPKTGTKMPKSSKCTKFKGMIKTPKMPKGATIPPGERDYAFMRVSLKGSDDCSEIQSFFEDSLCMDFNLVECSSVSDSVENSSKLSRGLDAVDVSFKSWSVIMQIFDVAAQSVSKKKERKKIEKKLKKLWKKEQEIDIDTLLSIDDIFSIMMPSAQPSSGSSLPSSLPSFQPSDSPSSAPSDISSDVPSDIPSDVPSDVPSDSPSDQPSSVPSSIPSDIPSDSPSDQPSSVPSSMPSDIPSDSPSDQPSSVPSSIPSDIPSDSPSDQPSSVPSSIPSDIPSDSPSDQPSSVPSSIPSDISSDSPSDQPSSVPSSMPSDIPSDSPSDQPSQLDWTQLGDDIDGEASGDNSGRSVSLSSDGKIVAIGAHLNDGVNGTNSGHVRVYEYDEANNKWNMLGDDIDGEDGSDRSGWRVSLSSDGKTVAIGARLNDGVNGTNSGHVRVYEYNETIEEWKMLGDDIDGEAAYDYTGRSVSLSSDGKTVAIGASGNDGVNGTDSGHVRVYEYDEADKKWNMLGDDIDGEAANDYSGWSVSLASDGRTVAIGATEADGVNGSNTGHVRVYEYDEADNKWNMLGDDIDGEDETDFSGVSVSLASDGRTVAIGAEGNDPSGHVRVYEYNETIEEWKMLGDDIDGEASGDNSGYSVSLSSDGKTVAIGDFRNDGVNGTDSGHVRVYEYDEANNKWNMLGDDIDGEAADDRFGGSVSLSSDGKTVAIGARNNDSNDNDNGGHVRVYQLQSV